MAEILIQGKCLQKSFGRICAVNDVSIEVRAGEIYGLVGPDGAGKTTLLRLFCGALHLDAGAVTMAGYDLATQTENAREQIGYLAQRFAMYDDLTVWENLRFFAEVRGMREEVWRQRSKEILEFVSLSEYADRLAGHLSGGMKQKLGLAAALVHRPCILLLDEPTTGVDPVTRQDFWRLIIRLVTQENVAVLVSTPYMDEASRCMRIGFMRKGKVFLEGQPGELRSRLEGQIFELQGHPLRLMRQVASRFAAVENVQMFGTRLHIRMKKGWDESIIAELMDELKKAGGDVENLQPINPQLEDIFIALLEDGK